MSYAGEKAPDPQLAERVHGRGNAPTASYLNCSGQEQDDIESHPALLRVRRRSGDASLGFADDELRRELTNTVELPSQPNEPGRAQEDRAAGGPEPSSTLKKRSHPLIRGSEARIVRTGRHSGFVGDVPVPRLNGKLVSGESMLELDFVTVTAAFEDDFVDIVSQPFTTTIVVNGRERKWTPDYLIKRKAGYDELCEIKLLSWLYHRDPAKRALAQARNSAMECTAKGLNYKYRLLTEDEIRVQPRLLNAKLIHRHSGPFAPKEQMVAALSALVRLPEMSSIDKLADALGDRWRRHSLGMAIRLEQAGHIRIDRRSRYCRVSAFKKVDTASVRVSA